MDPLLQTNVQKQPYLYMISSGNVRYIGQSFSQAGVGYRIFQHIAQAYKIYSYYVKFVHAYKGNRSFYRPVLIRDTETTTSPEKLLNEIRSLGACNMKYSINTDVKNCFGAGEKAYLDFASRWKRARGIKKPEDDTELKLDFAEIVAIYKFHEDKITVNRQSGGVNKLVYKPNLLINQLKTATRDQTGIIKRTIGTISNCIRKAAKEVTYFPSESIQADMKFLLNADKIALEKAFQYATSVRIIELKAFVNIITRAVEETKGTIDLRKQSKAKLRQLNQKFRGKIATKLKSHLETYIGKVVADWNIALKKTGIEIEITAEKWTSTISSEIASAIAKACNIDPEKNKTIKLKDLDYSVVQVTGTQTPLWLENAGDFLKSFTPSPDVKKEIADKMAVAMEIIYRDAQQRLPSESSAYQATKKIFKNSFLTGTKWVQFFDQAMDYLQRKRGYGKLLYDEKPYEYSSSSVLRIRKGKRGILYRFRRENGPYGIANTTEIKEMKQYSQPSITVW